MIMDLPKSEWIRNCPVCDKKITYNSKYSYYGAQKRNSVCKVCKVEKWKQTVDAWPEEKKKQRSERRKKFNQEHFSGQKNPMYGKHHTIEAIQKLKLVDKSYTKTNEFSQLVKNGMIGMDMSVYNFIQIWTDKYGVEEAHRRETQRREKLSKTMSGEGNPMFGKPAPLVSGGGIKGWYGLHFFRSLRELTYMLQLDNEGRHWKTGETANYVVTLINPTNGKAMTYRPDFIVDDTLMIECKPVNLQNTLIVKAKANAAIDFCSQRGMTYQMIDPGKLAWDKLFELERSGIVKLTKRTKDKLDENSCDFKGFTRIGKINVGKRAR